MNNLRVLFILFLSTLLSSCDYSVKLDFFIVQEDGAYYYAPEPGITSCDTSVYFSKEDLIFVPYVSQRGYGYGTKEYGLISIDKWFSEWKCDTMSVFFFSKETIESHSWDDIVHSYLVTQRYDFSKDDIKRIKGVIYFPPTSQMSGIKMWPQYGTYPNDYR